MFRLDNRTPNDCGFPGTWSKIAADLSLHTAAADGSNVGVVDGVNAPLVPVPEHNHGASSDTQGDHTHAATSGDAGEHTPTGAIWVDAVGDHEHGAGGSQDAHDHALNIYSGGSHTHNVSAKIKQDFLWGGVGYDAGQGYQGGAAEHHQDTNMGPIAYAAGDHTHGGVADVRQPVVYVDVHPAGTHAHTGGVTINPVGPHAHAITVPNAGAHAHGVTVDLAGTPGAVLDVRGARVLGNLWQRTA